MLKPCPCGKTPAMLYIVPDGGCKWNWASGSCCNEWHIEFRTQYETDPEKLQDMAAEYWNAAGRVQQRQSQ